MTPYTVCCNDAMVQLLLLCMHTFQFLPKHQVCVCSGNEAAKQRHQVLLSPHWTAQGRSCDGASLALAQAAHKSHLAGPYHLHHMCWPLELLFVLSRQAEQSVLLQYSCRTVDVNC